MRIFVTGRQGQLAQALVERCRRYPEVEIIALGRPQLDMEVCGSVGAAIAALQPDLIVNAAAYTAVDRAEDEPELVMRINADAAAEAAAAAFAIEVPIVQLSTDYVFDGTTDGAYREDAATNPLGTYGRSKLAAEAAVRRLNFRHLIVRTAWVYSPWGRNFVKTMLQLAGRRQEIGVVADQFGSPTSALDLAGALFAAFRHCRDDKDSIVWGTYHVAGRGQCSWADFAEEIFRVSERLGGPRASVRRITTAEFPTRACRPANSAFDSGKFERRFGFAMPHWRRAVTPTIQRLLANTGERRKGSADYG